MFRHYSLVNILYLMIQFLKYQYSIAFFLFFSFRLEIKLNQKTKRNNRKIKMSNLVLPPISSLLTTKIQPRLMKDTYKKVHIYLFDFQVVLGKGSFSKVYKGINLNTNQQVAVKVIQMDSISTPKLKQLLLQQIDILMKIKHQNLIKCFEVLSSNKNTYIIMQLCTHDFGSICGFIRKQEQDQKAQMQSGRFMNAFQVGHFKYQQSNKATNCAGNKRGSKDKDYLKCNGESVLTKSMNSNSSTKSGELQQDYTGFLGDVQSERQSQGPLKQQKFYPFIKQIFMGLEYLNRQNIVHRDLKLSNIFLTKDQACKMGDFGFATIIPPSQNQIRDTCCIGSPLYMSPQSYVQNTYSLKSDIWSFGIMIFEMVYGNPPHWSCPSHEALKWQIKRPVNLGRFEALAKISDEMKQVIEGCLQVQVKKRFNISELKQTKLFKRLFYQPLQSIVIVTSRNRQNIQQSSVQILGRPVTKVSPLKSSDQDKYFQSSNYSKLHNIKQPSHQSNFINLQKDSPMNVTQKQRQQINQSQQKAQKSQFLKHSNSCMKLGRLQLSNNNSPTDRRRSIDAQNKAEKQSFKNPEKNQTIQQNNVHDAMYMKFNSTDLNGNIFKEVNKIKVELEKTETIKQKQDFKDGEQFAYKNSEGLQKYLKQFKEQRYSREKAQIQPSQQSHYIKKTEKPMTFQNLTLLLDSPQLQKQTQEKEVQSPKFAFKFTTPFFNSNKYSKQQRKHFINNFTRDNSPSKQAQNDMNADLKTANCSMFQKYYADSKPLSSYSPRHSPKFSTYNTTSSTLRKQDKQNVKGEDLVRKNYSVGVSPNNSFKKNSNDISKIGGYEFKTKLLQKSTSSPRFQISINEAYNKDHQEKANTKHMACSTFFSGNKYASSPKDNDQSTPTITKDFNLREQGSKNNSKIGGSSMKSHNGSSNYLTQFASKIKQQASNIQKKTYWKSSSKHQNINGGGADSSHYKLEQTQNLMVTRNDANKGSSALYATMAPVGPVLQAREEVHPQIPSKKDENQALPSFKLLTGEIIIKDACELIHFSRMLYKLSFITQTNSNSLTLLQYSIQALNNLSCKCDNFEIKYHYDSSVHNSLEIRQSFKANQAYLGVLSQLSEKECYVAKKDIGMMDRSTSACNKTIQLKAIIHSYLSKLAQRKQALVKLLDCNALFQNLANKASSKLDLDKPSLLKKTQLNSERGFLNFSKLQKTLQQIKTQLSSNNQQNKPTTQMGHNNNNKQSSQSNDNLRVIIIAAQSYIDSIIRCVRQHSFLGLDLSIRQAVKTLLKSDCAGFSKVLQKTNDSNHRSIAEIILDGLQNCSKNYKEPLQTTNLTITTYPGGISA